MWRSVYRLGSCCQTDPKRGWEWDGVLQNLLHQLDASEVHNQGNNIRSSRP